MRKFVLALAVLAFVGLSQPVAAACYTGGTWSFSYCQNVTVYNNDTLYALGVNSTVVLPRFNSASLIAAGKMLTSGADLILAYGKNEIARFNGTDWNNDTVPILFNTQVAIAKGSSDSNYSLYYGDATAVLSSRDYNASHVGWFGDDFLGTGVNTTGQWGYTTGTGGQVKVNCYRSTCNFDNTGNSSNYNLMGWNNTGYFTQTNSSVWFRMKNAGGSALATNQFVAGSCDQTDTVQCGGLGSPAYGFKEAAGATGALYYGQNSNTLDYDPGADGIYEFLKIHFEPVVSRQQYWRDFDSINKGNTTIAWTNGWYTAFGGDGSGSQTNYTLDWVIVGKESVVNQPSLQTATEQANTLQTVTIYTPTVTTYYNTTSQSVIFDLNSTTNSSNMAVWVNNSGTISFLGYVANGTVNTTSVSVTSKSQLLTVIAYDGTANRSASVSYTIYNGLNLTVYNASQAASTYLASWTYNVSNSTNQTVSTASSPQSIETRSIPNGATVNLNILKSGYAERNFTSFTYSNASAFYSFTIPLWRLQEFHFDSGNGTNVTSYTIYFYQSGLNSSWSTSNGTIQVSLGSIPSGTTIAQFVATGFNATNQSFSINSTSEINFTATTTRAGIIIYAFDESFPTSRLNFSFMDTNGSSTGQDYNKNYFWNASYTNSSLVQGTVTFTFNDTADGTYGNRNYILTINSNTATTLNVYFLNYSLVTAVYENVCTITSSGSAIAGATVTFQKSISGSYVTIGQLTTGSDGCASLWTDTATLYQIIASATGYNTGTVTAYGKSTQYLILTSTTATLGWSTSYGDDLDIILSRLLPEQTSVSTDPIVVNFTVYSYNATLTGFGMYCDYNGTSIYNVNVSGSPSGGSTTSSIATSNKTNPTYFYCYGFFSRSGYNNTYVNRTFYIYTANTTFSNSSISQTVNNSITGNFSTGTLTLAAIVLTTVGTAGLTGVAAGAGAPLGAGVISVALITGFGFLGWISPLLVILYWVAALAFAYFNSRQF